MASISRRTFLKQGGTGAAAAAAAAGVLAAIPVLPARAWAAQLPPAVRGDGVAAPDGRAATGPIVVHVPGPRSGEVRFMVGKRELVHRDRALVARLVRADS